jgi:uncharacterized protein YjdB
MLSSMAARSGLAAPMFVLAGLVSACGEAVDPGPARIPVASVAVSPAADQVVVGARVTLAATPIAPDGGVLDRTVTWSSENEALATVNSSGVVTTRAPGQVGIKATSEGKVGRALLTIVGVPVADVRLSVETEIVLPWDGFTHVTAVALDADGNVLSDRPAQWRSGNPSVATVTNGTIRAVRAGTTTITATVDDVPASVSVRVNLAPVVEVYIDAQTTGLEIGDVGVFGSRVKRASGDVLYTPATWSSSAPAVAKVVHTDIWYAAVEAFSEGTVTLTATVEGKSASLTLFVAPRSAFDLIYNRWADAASEIFSLSLATEGETPVRLNAGNVSREPSPSPDGTQVVFAISQQDMQGQWQHDLFIVNRNGANMRWLTRAPGLEDQPHWSPDGRKILFHGVDNGRADLFVINVDGTGLTNVTSAMPAEVTDKRDPAWSPDGSRIAFIAVRNGQYKVWTIGADGSNAAQLTTDTGFDESPTWSPAGDRIAFTRYNATATANGDDVMIVSAQGGTPSRLSLPGDQRSPSWSPDGRLIAVSGTAVAGQGMQEIYTLRPDGTGLRLRTVNPAWGGGLNPAWIKRP